MIEFVPDPGPARLQQRIELLGESVRRFPGNLNCHRALSRALHAAGDMQAAIAAADAGLSHFPGDAELGAVRIGALLKTGQEAVALAEARALSAAAPKDRAAGEALLDALSAAGLGRERADAAEAMPWLAENAHYRLVLAAAELRRGEASAEALLACADAVLARSPGNANATYHRAIALARLSRAEEAREALALDRHLAIGEIGADLPALAREIRANPTLTADPALNSTTNGHQTLRLRQPGDVALPALFERIEAAVRAYAAERAGQGDSFAAAMPRRARLQNWAVITGADGRQGPHFHADGWLSGVFYVEAPRVEGRYRGALLLGPVGDIVPGDPPWGIREIEPVPGRLVLFPSWTPHATEPPGVPGDRIVVAFDVLPLDAS